MITTNMPALVQQLSALGDVRVHDHTDSIDLQLDRHVDINEVDDLMCDALFVDPVRREQGPHGWVIHLYKRDNLRSASDLHMVRKGTASEYRLRDLE